jgi:enterochelin esterase-like enzyme
MMLGPFRSVSATRWARRLLFAVGLLALANPTAHREVDAAPSYAAPVARPGTSTVRQAEAAFQPGPRPSGSVVREEQFFSTALGREMTYLVYVPAEYDTADRPYAVLYLLHGVAGDSREWGDVGAPDAADRLIDSGAIEPLLIVFPYANASYYVNKVGGEPRWSDYLVEDLVQTVDATFRTLPRASSRAVGGLSMGGDGALQLALRFPDVFGIAGAHSPSSRILFENAPADVYGDETYFRAHNPFWLAQNPPPNPPTVWIDVGDEDPWQWNAGAISGALAAAGVEHEFNLLPGMHDGDYWIGNLDRYLDFYDRAFERP